MASDSQTTKPERHVYHGSLTSISADTWVDVDAYDGGYAPLIRVSIGFGGGQTWLCLEPEEAAEIGRHLTEAAVAATANVEVLNNE